MGEVKTDEIFSQTLSTFSVAENAGTRSITREKESLRNGITSKQEGALSIYNAWH